LMDARHLVSSISIHSGLYTHAKTNTCTHTRARNNNTCTHTRARNNNTCTRAESDAVQLSARRYDTHSHIYDTLYKHTRTQAHALRHTQRHTHTHTNAHATYTHAHAIRY
jgi:hypothetical protein